MKWFNKWLYKKMKQARNSEDEIVKELAPPSTRVENERTMTLNVTKANGGWVIDHRQYDKQRDRNNSSVHIITDDKDLGEELGKIVTFESLYK